VVFGLVLALEAPVLEAPVLEEPVLEEPVLSLLALVPDLGLVPWGLCLPAVCLAPVVFALTPPLVLRPLVSLDLVPVVLELRPAVWGFATPDLGLVGLVSLLLAFGLGAADLGFLADVAEPELEPELDGILMSIGLEPEPDLDGISMSTGPDPEKSIWVPPMSISVSPGTARSMTSLISSDPANGKADTSCKPKKSPKTIRWTVMIGCKVG